MAFDRVLQSLAHRPARRRGAACQNGSVCAAQNQPRGPEGGLLSGHPLTKISFEPLLCGRYGTHARVPTFLGIIESSILTSPAGAQNGGKVLHPHRGLGGSSQVQGREKQAKVVTARRQGGTAGPERIPSVCWALLQRHFSCIRVRSLYAPNHPATLQMKKLSHRNVQECALGWSHSACEHGARKGTGTCVCGVWGPGGGGGKAGKSGKECCPPLADEEAQVLIPVMPLWGLGAHFPHLPDQ